MTNRLIHETSPYLLQHAHNPVDWYPWGEKALQKAQERQVPILLSIGYSACHWCHVMERETFENADIAKYMNDHFVCVKVDREERPDIDEIYMIATVSMNRGQGGWPMTVFMTPDQEPFFAGTYFPPEDLGHMPGFKKILQQIAYAWEEKRDVLHATAMNISRQLRAAYQGVARASVELKKGCDAAVAYWKERFDPVYGGFSQAPKFPCPITLKVLHRLYVEHKDPHLLEMACTTLDGMARGGIYDHLGGGFARYSTDNYWFVPHFEKMLYDNAMLAHSYLEAFQITQNPWYRQIAHETLSFVLREMTSSQGGFLSSIDADSEGEEGKYYVWSSYELREILSTDECELAIHYFGVTEIGNWEGKNILYLTQTIESLAEEFNRPYEECYKIIASAKKKLLSARQKRVRPGLDDKVLTSWNALMIGAMADGYRILREPSFFEAAKLAADFILSTLTQEGRLLRTYRSGKAHLNAYLQDYAYVIDALTKLYEAGASYHYLEHAERHLAPHDFQEPL